MGGKEKFKLNTKFYFWHYPQFLEKKKNNFLNSKGVSLISREQKNVFPTITKGFFNIYFTKLPWYSGGKILLTTSSHNSRPVAEEKE